MKISTLFISTLLVMLSYTSAAKAEEPVQDNWRAELTKNLPVLGHRNFIVIAESVYPQQSNPGIKTIYTGGTQIAVLKEVLAAVNMLITSNKEPL
jgi:L-fucose mutarotase/ribose pyranase (RbsD/FucU family)